MNSDPLTIKKIKLKHLDEFARNALNDPAFEKVAPISRLRAKSQAKNPQGEPDDIALLAALHENRCVGYHGLLPGLLKNKDRASKIYWLVTFYLDAAFRGRGYGKQLVTEILNTKIDLVTTGITESAAGVYRRIGFQPLGELTYYQLRRDNPNFFSTIFQKLQLRKKEFTSRSVNRLIGKLETTPTRLESSISFQRDIAMINWMIRNPWVVSKPNAQKDVKHYYFSRVRDLFEFIPLEILAPDGKTRKGYLILSISRKKEKTTLKVLDFYFHNPDDIFIAGYYALQYANKYQADRLEFPADLKSFLNDQSALTPIVKRKRRLYLFHPRDNDSPMARLAPQIKLNYCDSDTAFT